MKRLGPNENLTGSEIIYSYVCYEIFSLGDC